MIPVDYSTDTEQRSEGALVPKTAVGCRQGCHAGGRDDGDLGSHDRDTYALPAQDGPSSARRLFGADLRSREYYLSTAVHADFCSSTHLDQNVLEEFQ